MAMEGTRRLRFILFTVWLICLAVVYVVFGATCANPVAGEPRHITKALSLKRVQQTFCTSAARRTHVGMRWIRLPAPAATTDAFCAQCAPWFAADTDTDTTTVCIVKPGQWSCKQRGVFPVATRAQLATVLQTWDRELRKACLGAQYFVVQLYHPGPWELRLTVRRAWRGGARLFIVDCVGWRIGPRFGSSGGARTILEGPRYVSLRPAFQRAVLDALRRGLPLFRVGTVDVRTRCLRTAHEDFRILEVNGGFGQSGALFVVPFSYARVVGQGVAWAARTWPHACLTHGWNPLAWGARLALEYDWGKQAHAFETVAITVHDKIAQQRNVRHGRVDGPL